MCGLEGQPMLIAYGDIQKNFMLVYFKNCSTGQVCGGSSRPKVLGNNSVSGSNCLGCHRQVPYHWNILTGKFYLRASPLSGAMKFLPGRLSMWIIGMKDNLTFLATWKVWWSIRRATEARTYFRYGVGSVQKEVVEYLFLKIIWICPRITGIFLCANICLW